MTFFGVDVRNGVPVGLGSIAAFGRRGFTPASLFAQGEAGVWYDPSDLGTMFTTSDGTTPVTGVEQAVGLILDKSRGLVQSQFSTNDNFASGATGWSAQSGWSVGTGSASVNSSAGTTLLRTSATSVAGRAYIISFVVSSYTSGLFRAVAGTAFAGTASAIGTYTFIVFSNGGAGAGIWADSTNTVGTITSLSVREIAGTHAIQPTAASRPVLRSRYNLLTYSEDFSNAAWAKDAVTVSGQTITASAGAGFHYISRADAALTGSVTVTWEVKRDNNDWLLFTINDSSINYFNISTGTFGATNPDGLTAVALEDGWYRVTGVRSLSAVQADCGLGLASGNGGGNFTAAGTEKVLVRKVDCRRTIDAISGIPSYQKVEAATVYDTVGFPVYLSFDGSDDSLYTAANLDLSSTDKVTVWAGVTKLSDGSAGTYGCIAELGTDINSVNGTWALFGPAAAPGGTPDFGMSSRGTLTANAIASSNAAPITRVMTGEGQIGGLPFVTLRLDGTQAASGINSQGTGNYASAVVNIGRRNNATLPFNGRLYQLIGRGAATAAALIQQAERWVAGKQGRAL